MTRSGTLNVLKIGGKHVGANVGGEAAAQSDDRVHLPAADDFAERAAARQPRLAGSERQFVSDAGGEDLRNVDGRVGALAGDVVGIHRDAGAAVLRVSVGPGAARLEILLDRVVHQQGESLRISLLHAEVDGVVVVGRGGDTSGSPFR